MSLRVIGAGRSRTGTTSLKLALEKLLGAPCYHMREVLAHPEHIPIRPQAALGILPQWPELFAGYAATVDTPASYFWPELVAAFPEALVLLSVRDAESWWRSASATIYSASENMYRADFPAKTQEWIAMRHALRAARWITNIQDREATIQAFEAHNARVRDAVPADRLVIWQPGDGWEPICQALNLPIPDEPFPHANTQAEWQARNASAPRAQR